MVGAGASRRHSCSWTAHHHSMSTRDLTQQKRAMSLTDDLDALIDSAKLISAVQAPRSRVVSEPGR